MTLRFGFVGRDNCVVRSIGDEREYFVVVADDGGLARSVPGKNRAKGEEDGVIRRLRGIDGVAFRFTCMVQVLRYAGKDVVGLVAMTAMC